MLENILQAGSWFRIKDLVRLSGLSRSGVHYLLKKFLSERIVEKRNHAYSLLHPIRSFEENLVNNPEMAITYICNWLNDILKFEMNLFRENYIQGGIIAVRIPASIAIEMGWEPREYIKTLDKVAENEKLLSLLKDRKIIIEKTFFIGENLAIGYDVNPQFKKTLWTEEIKITIDEDQKEAWVDETLAYILERLVPKLRTFLWNIVNQV